MQCVHQSSSVSDPAVSFVVLSYNFAPFLAECIRSILDQEGEHRFEIILVDDASTDGTERLLESFNDPRLKVIRHTENLGHVRTVNEALSYVCGRYVAKIDGDDRYRRSFLSTVLPKFDAFPDVGLVYGDAAIIDDRGRVTMERSDRVHGGRDFKGNEFLRLLEENCICAPTAIARREMWQRALPVPAGLAFNDWYFNVMLARQCECYYLHRVLADYRVHSGNHHTRIVRDKTEEPSIFSILDRVFNEVESWAPLEKAKRRGRQRIYGRHYLTLADKYFGMGMNGDARRCYWAAVRNWPQYMLNVGVQRRLAATIVGRRRYDFGKTLVKSVCMRNQSRR